MSMTQTSDQLQQQIWATEQEILDVIHQVCTEHGLRYSLAYGTLLGAVRHKGFIPWDDDIDLMMPREDYEKLLVIWNQSAPKGYILQNTRTDSDFTQNFTKIRKDHTTFLQDEAERTKHYHKGIFVDIFPGDRVPSGKLEKTVQYIACAINLLYSRGHTSGSGGLIGKAESILLKAPKKKYTIRRERAEKSIRRWNGKLFCTAGQLFLISQSLSLPWMLKKIGGRDRKMLTALMVLGFLAYFYYANAINQPFDQDFARLSLSEYLAQLGG